MQGLRLASRYGLLSPGKALRVKLLLEACGK